MRLSFAIAAALTLGACNASEPSELELQSAMLRYYMGPDSKVIDKEHIWLKGESGYRQYVEVKKLACKSSGDNPGAACDFAIETCIARSEDGCAPEKANISGRFVKADEGWQFMPDNPMTAPGRPVDILGSIEMADMVGSGGIAGCVPSTLTPEEQKTASRLGAVTCK